MEYHVMGSVSQVRMKPGCMPKKFIFQSDGKTQTFGTTDEPYIAKKRTMMILKSAVTEQSSSEEIAISSGIFINLFIRTIRKDNFSDK